MGCDIHMYGEIRTDGKWRPLFAKGGGADKYGFVDEPNYPALYTGRNYGLFCLLTGTRSYNDGDGPPIFGGTPKHDGIVGVDYPGRGLPHDLSDEYRNEGTIWEHTFSFATLEELDAVDWDAPFSYVRYEEVEKRRDVAGEFLDTAVAILRAFHLICDVPKSDIRIVWGYDN